MCIARAGNAAVTTPITSYHELRRQLNIRRVELGMTMIDVDRASGLPGGYASKIFCGDRNLGPKSFGVVLGALRLAIRLEPL